MQRFLQLNLHADDSGTLSAQVSSSSGGRLTPPQPLEGLSRSALETLAASIARSVADRRPLAPALQTQARDLFTRLFSGEIARVFDQLRGEAVTDQGQLLVRLMLPDASLQAFPWEVMRGPSPMDGELAYHPQIQLARGVFSSSPSLPREVVGAVRLLVVAPEADEASIDDLRDSLAESIESGQIEWLEPVFGEAARWRYLLQRLQRPPRPHLIHFVGHGRVNDGMPELKLAGEDEWVSAEHFSTALAANELRLVYLESCVGADPGALASAAERIAARGIDAVIAHLWPVAADTARIAARGFYGTLTGMGDDGGNVGSSLNSARLGLAGELRNAEFLAPVLFLRGTDPVLFDFRRRTLTPPAPRPDGPAEPAKPLDARAGQCQATLAEVLRARPTLLLGDHIDPSGHQVGVHQLRGELANHLEADDPATLFGMLQRYEFVQDREELKDLFRVTLDPLHRGLAPPFLNDIDGLTKLVAPGLFMTLLWFPLLELALAHHHPRARILVYQPLEPGGLDRLRAFEREPRSGRWQRLKEVPSRPDFERDYVILRLYGGYSAETQGMFGDPVMTEDNQLEELSVIDTLPSHLLAAVRSNPMLLVGLCPSEWSHRELLRRVTGGQPLVSPSLAVLRPGARASERRYWESRSGPSGRAGGMQVWSFEELELALRASR